MVRGICVICKQQVGGFLQPRPYRCPNCGKLYHYQCSPKITIGFIFKSLKPCCRDCGTQLY
jgi:hypothetical protein